MSKDSQYYSKIALKHLQNLSKKEGVERDDITYGDLQLMEDLFDLFGGDRGAVYAKGLTGGSAVAYRFQYVIRRLDRESKKSDAIFTKFYLNYPGIINKPARCFVLKDHIKRGDKSDC